MGMLGRVRLLLEGPDSEENENAGTVDLRQRVQELRQEVVGREVEERTAGAWWDQAFTQVRTWLDDKEPSKLFSRVLALPLNPMEPTATPSGTESSLRSPSCRQM